CSARGDEGLALANRIKPDAVLLDPRLAVVDGWRVLERLKRNPSTRHIPVQVLAGTPLDAGGRRRAARSLRIVQKPGDGPGQGEALLAALRRLSDFLDRPKRKLLLVEDDDHQRDSIVELVAAGDDVDVTAVRSARDALAALETGPFDGMVADLVLPG